MLLAELYANMGAQQLHQGAGDNNIGHPVVSEFLRQFAGGTRKRERSSLESFTSPQTEELTTIIPCGQALLFLEKEAPFITTAAWLRLTQGLGNSPWERMTVHSEGPPRFSAP